MNGGWLAGLLLAGGLAVSDTSAIAASPRREPAREPAELGAILARFDEAQEGFRTLSAEFTETRVSPLLKEPQVAKGRFYMNKPDSVLWEYTSPEVMRFVIAQGEYVGYFPARKQAERRDIRRWKDQIFRYFGLGQVSAQLRRLYDIRLGEPGASMEGTILLVLDPKKRRIKKQIESARFWIDASSCLPVQVEYRNTAGNTRLIRFHGTRVNEALSASLFRLEIPSDVTVTTGFRGLAGQSLESDGASQ